MASQPLGGLGSLSSSDQAVSTLGKLNEEKVGSWPGWELFKHVANNSPRFQPCLQSRGLWPQPSTPFLHPF